MSIQVTRRKVAAARIVHALDQAEGRQSDEWISRLVNAKEAARPAPSGADRQQKSGVLLPSTRATR